MSRILVIDDDPQVCRLLVTVLEQAGHEVRCIADGKRGLEHLAAWPASVVITDMLMPGTDGIEIIMAIARDHPDVRIIAISGGNDSASDVLGDALLLGAHQVIEKPFGPRRLLDVIGKALGSPPTSSGETT